MKRLKMKLPPPRRLTGAGRAPAAWASARGPSAWVPALVATLLAVPAWVSAQGFPISEDPRLTWEGNLSYAATAATLLDCSPSSCGGGGFGGLPGNLCRGLDQASAVLDVIPESPTLRIVHAQLKWAASMPVNQPPDLELTLVPPGGAPVAVVADQGLLQHFEDRGDANTCLLLELSCGVPDHQCALGLYSAGADVTAALEAHRAGGGTLNGVWTVRDAQISGADPNDPATGAAAVASLAIGAWSMFIIYEDTENLPLRRIYYYQGFELLAGNNRVVRPRGFLAPADPTVQLTYLVLEGDADIRGDALRVNGREVQDACNPQDNVFNSTVNSGRLDNVCQRDVYGVDLDTYVVARAIEAGDEEATIEFVVPRGDGLLTPGEQLLTDWLILAFDHRLPSFESVKPQKVAQPPSGSVVAAGDRIRYQIVVENTGGDQANNVVVRDATPEHTTYVAGSATVDGIAIGDGPEGSNPFSVGFNLSAWRDIGPFDPDERHVAAFAVTVDDDTPDETAIENVASIVADELEAPVPTEAVEHFVGARPDGGVQPGDLGPAPDLGPEDDGGPRPDTGPRADTGPASDRGPRRDADVRADAGADLGCPPGEVFSGGRCVSLSAEPDCHGGDSPCGPGTTLRDGQCVSICGEGLVWDPNCATCGQCRQSGADPCPARTDGGLEGGAGGTGCGCDTTRNAPSPGWLALVGVLMLGRRRRRRAPV